MYLSRKNRLVFSAPFLEIKLELVAYHTWNLNQFIVEFYHYNRSQNRKFIFYIYLSHCICLVVWDDILQLSFCLVIFDGIWRKFSGSFLALKRANELIFIVKVWSSLWHINQVKITTSNQMPGNFDINANSVCRLNVCTKNCVQIDSCLNWIFLYPVKW